MVKKTFAVVSGALALVTALALTGCTTDDGGSGGGGAISDSAQAALDAAYKGYGGDLVIDPVAVKSGIKMGVVSCGQQVPGCAVPAQGMMDAATAAGWTPTLYDGKLNPQGFADAIRQAIAGGANVISAVGIGCGVAQAAWQEAKDAGITIVGGGGVDDCDPKIWDSERLFVDGHSPLEMMVLIGQLQADYIYGMTNGAPKTVVLNFTGQSWGQAITDGFNAEMEKLGAADAAIATVDISDPEFADGSYVQKAISALQKNPDANSMIAPIDAWYYLGLGQALVENELASKLITVGRGGDAPAMDMIRAGGQGLTATIGNAIQWGAWGSIDTAARVLASQKPVYINDPIVAIDATHNLPTAGEYEGAIDFKQVFKEAWGVK